MDLMENVRLKKKVPEEAKQNTFSRKAHGDGQSEGKQGNDHQGVGLLGRPGGEEGAGISRKCMASGGAAWPTALSQ